MGNGRVGASMSAPTRRSMVNYKTFKFKAKKTTRKCDKCRCPLQDGELVMKWFSGTMKHKKCPPGNLKQLVERKKNSKWTQYAPEVNSGGRA